MNYTVHYKFDLLTGSLTNTHYLQLLLKLFLTIYHIQLSPHGLYQHERPMSHSIPDYFWLQQFLSAVVSQVTAGQLFQLVNLVYLLQE